MTIGELLRRWLESNREFLRQQRASRAVSRQDSYRVGEIYGIVHEQFDPCFVLSTGRTGTMLLTKVLAAHPGVEAFHEPRPEPNYHSAYAYRHAGDRGTEIRAMIDSLRYELIRDTFFAGRKYVETNNRITFFAYQLAALYPKARFVHLLRKPSGFVRSGCARGWYTDQVITDEGRIRPVDEAGVNWDRLSQAGKIAWLWNETNGFIEEFKKSIAGDRSLTIRSEDMFKDPDVSKSIFELVGVPSLCESKLKRLLRRPVNLQRRSTLRALSSEEQSEVEAMTPLADSYYAPSR